MQTFVLLKQFSLLQSYGTNHSHVRLREMVRVSLRLRSLLVMKTLEPLIPYEVLSQFSLLTINIDFIIIVIHLVYIYSQSNVLTNNY